MEHTNKIKQERRQLAMVIGMYLAMILLLIALIVIVKNVKELKSDPIVYGIEQKGFAVCSCYDYRGNSYDYNSTGAIPTKSYGYNIQLIP